MKLKKAVSLILSIVAVILAATTLSSCDLGDISIDKDNYESSTEDMLDNVTSTQTPVIGYNGNWWFGNIDTGIPAEVQKGEKGDKGDKGDKGEKGDKGDKGDNGITPHIGSNGNWWIGDTDTGVYAGKSSNLETDNVESGDNYGELVGPGANSGSDPYNKEY